MSSSTKQKADGVYGLELVCKDMRNLKFALKNDKGDVRRKIFETLQSFAFPISNGQSFFAFAYNDEFRINGWEVCQLMF